MKRDLYYYRHSYIRARHRYRKFLNSGESKKAWQEDDKSMHYFTQSVLLKKEIRSI